MSESLVISCHCGFLGKSSVNLCGGAGLLFSPCAALRRSLVATTGVSVTKQGTPATEIGWGNEQETGRAPKRTIAEPWEKS